MKRNNAIAAVILIAATLLLTACGFHLRGSRGETNLPFKTIFVAIPESSALAAEMKRTIRSNGGTEVVTDRKKAQVILETLAENRRKTILSLNSQGRVREYTLTYQVRFQVRDQNNAILLQPTDIVLRRTLAFSEQEALAKQTEEQMLYQDMQSDLVQQILRRLTAIKIPAETAAPSATTPAATSQPAGNAVKN